MKKPLWAVIPAALLMLMAPAATGSTAAAHPCAIPQQDWMKWKAGTWVAKKDGKTCLYKLDKNAQVWWSRDGKEWQAVEGGMWADKDGRWLKIGDGKLWWTADAGKNFSEVPEWKWEAPDGRWYKFDAKWTLWVNR